MKNRYRVDTTGDYKAEIIDLKTREVVKKINNGSWSRCGQRFILWELTEQ